MTAITGKIRALALLLIIALLWVLTVGAIATEPARAAFRQA